MLWYLGWKEKFMARNKVAMHLRRNCARLTLGLLFSALAAAGPTALVAQDPSKTQKVIGPQAASYKTQSARCFEMLLLPDHLKCMQHLYDQLGKQTDAALATALEATSTENQNPLRAAVHAADAAIAPSCFKEIMGNGPGTLNKRRHALCQNDSRFAILQQITQDAASLIADQKIPK
jgi:hypothetical protein